MSSLGFAERVPYIELHPTNNCIFHCPYCTYGQFDNRRGKSLSKVQIDQVLDLRPEFVLICGGGDPTSFSITQDGTRFRLPELRAHMRRSLKGVKIMIGTHAGFGAEATEITNCLTMVSRVGISLNASFDASQPDARHRDPDAFERALTNIAEIVLGRSHKGKSTYVGSTFTAQNWHNLFTIAKALFDKLAARGVDPCAVRVKFGATLIADDTRPADPYYASLLSNAEKSEWRSHYQRLNNESETFARFIADRTVLSAPPKYKRPAKGVKRCGMVEQYVLAAADGQYYPCCVMAAKGECSLGAISDTDVNQLAANRREFYLHGTPRICAEGCRIRNHTLMGKKAWTTRQHRGTGAKSSP